MESWQYALDKWLTTPPEDKESHLLCDRCSEPFYPEDKVYDLEGEKLCEDCAYEWLEAQATKATEEQCYE